MRIEEAGLVVECDLRLLRTTVAKFKATGNDWQERINEMLASEAAKLQ